MDIFIEEVVKKEKTLGDKLLMMGIILLCAMVSGALYFAAMFILPQFAPVILLIILAIVYITYLFIGNFNLEYEYALVNSEIDIDKIAAKKRRKKLTSVNLLDLYSFGKKESQDYSKYLKDVSIKKVFAGRRKDGEDIYFLVYTEDTVKKMLVFSPTEKIISVIEKLNKRKINR